MVEEKEEMEKITQVEDNEEYSHPNPKDRQFVLLLRVTQADGQPLPMKEFTSRAMVQMICDVTGLVPKEVEILTDQEVVVEVEDQSSIVEVSRGIQGLVHWGGQAVTVDSIVCSLRFDNRDCERARDTEGETKAVRTRATMIERKSTDVSTTND